MENKKSFGALLPIAVFVLLYLGLGITLEYVLQVPMGFYNVSVVVVFMIALLVACLQAKGINMNEKLKIMANSMADPNIITMILIFLMAGVFVGVLGRSSAESVAYFLLSLIPADYAIPVLFLISAFVSLAMGTSVGTITLITPIAIAIGGCTGYPMPLCVGTVMGGAMFGDNLSFISDTTIAACNGQGCQMQDKFKANFKIAVPAAILTVGALYFLTLEQPAGNLNIQDYNLIQIIPYLLVLIGGIMGFNVFGVLLVGIISGSILMLGMGEVTPLDYLANIGKGTAGMFETSMVAILVSCIGGLIAYNGGFNALLSTVHKVFSTKKGGMLGIGMLVGFMDIATANNTVAIVMTNPIAKQISESFKISPKESASLLDTFSCIFQGILPYGAQMLVALSIAASLGWELSAFHVLPYLLYPYLLLLSSILFVFLPSIEED
ncbi:Methionine transporter MetT [Anaerovibrio sp. JC8]|uniref:Na+/H+ antiporter NhaC family protein n=1 Tax=Anaerovibrio sp. JC8 TaxID=1240085 RepID=UPI000A09C521|nr:Na+/H+ antiporter NhaC family protein [Anaerovibrio sp. JC8]ORU00043.1 Methionine transporter MetT [Anaerovibrio sp. JC8]